MENYKALAIQYLKKNKRRTMLTILGTALTVVVLYILLNLGFSHMDMKKAEIIEDGDYEMILFTETAEEIRAITNDSVVEKILVGGYYLASEERELSQALYVTGDSPYHINKNFEYLTSTYGVGGIINNDLAAFYLQGDQGNTIYIMILLFFFVAIIFAIFGVGVIRNSIQLSLFEQIKDYGNLRCIGATVSQLRTIIYLQGLMMETAGIIVGVTVGQLMMSVVGVFVSFKMSFHIIPAIMIMIAYYGDLYFAMEENCKLVTGMSPISALRGEFRIRKEKIKKRRKSIYGGIFGVAGDYAYKNLMRSPGRFYRSVGAMFLGISALIAFLGVTTTFNNFYKQMDTMFKHYQVYYTYPYDMDTTIDKVHKNLPSTEWLQSITEIDAITEAKRMYRTQVMLTDRNQIYDHVVKGNGLWTDPSVDEAYREEIREYESVWDSMLDCYGYDEEDYARLEECLVEGTLDVSENGIVLVNGCKTMMEDEESLGVVMEQITFTDIHVGDTIDVVDTEKLHTMVTAEVEKVKDKEEYSYPDILVECREQLIEQGEYETYVVEGILEDDSNYMESYFSIVLPLEQYYEFTGTDESYVTGMRYHVDGDLSNKDLELLTGVDLSMSGVGEDSVDYSLVGMVNNSYWESQYPYMVAGINEIKQIMKYVLFFACFIVVVSSVNIINTTSSNLHMRRKEFAQLRVIGVSKKELMKMVVLEGVITTIVANLWGQLVGNLLSYGIFYFVKMVYGIEYDIPWLGMALGLLLSIIVLCGSVYVPMRNMKQNMAEDLSASGE